MCNELETSTRSIDVFSKIRIFRIHVCRGSIMRLQLHVIGIELRAKRASSIVLCSLKRRFVFPHEKSFRYRSRCDYPFLISVIIRKNFQLASCWFVLLKCKVVSICLIYAYATIASNYKSYLKIWKILKNYVIMYNYENIIFFSFFETSFWNITI